MQNKKKPKVHFIGQDTAKMMDIDHVAGETNAAGTPVVVDKKRKYRKEKRNVACLPPPLSLCVDD